jgi:hypothetical protein
MVLLLDAPSNITGIAADLVKRDSARIIYGGLCANQPLTQERNMAAFLALQHR